MSPKIQQSNKCLLCDNTTSVIGRKYCSRKCYWVSKLVRVDVECSGCKKVFKRIPSRVVEKSYCSHRCSGVANRAKYKTTQEHREKMRVIARERGYGKWMVGKPGNTGSFKKGQFSKEKHPFWKGGITPINQQIRHSDEYVAWRSGVFERDDFRCQWCGVRGGKLQADHIFPFSLHPNKRFNANNGRTLCLDCHKKRTATQMSVLWANQFTNSLLQ